MKKESVLVAHKDMILLGQILNGGPGTRMLEILQLVFMSRLSYTRGEADHTAFLEGQKSVIEFMINATKAARAETRNE